MSDPTNPLEWVEYAEEDWRSAKRLLRGNRPSTTNSCFHAQQSAEKYLKALLVSKKAYFPKTHDLSSLDMICAENGILTGFSTSLLTILSDYAVATRYPGEMPTMEDAKEAIEIAKSVRKFARKWLGLK
jgi:HEPN domain-containing protein